MTSFLLDSEGLSLLADGDKRMQAVVELAHRTDATLHVSAVTLAETTDGGPRDAKTRRAVAATSVEVVDGSIGYLAGRLRAAAASGRKKLRDLTVDAAVAATALALPGPVVVVTDDPDDFSLLLDGSAIKILRP